ncbi:flavin reductase family protein [Mycolicibacterium litorale]|uniref:flavin reductase family protein n=1 Tax=Mycolicibacterium litorale TaxID=758802 RepID=UPI003CF58382
MQDQELIDEYRRVLGLFPTGVVVVSGLSDGTPVGLTVQSFMALSLRPPMILLSVDRKSTSWPLIAATGKLAVNVMAADQGDVALTFAKSGTDKFAGIPWTPAPHTGVPLIEGCQAWIEGEVACTYDGGDHVIITVDVLTLHAGPDAQPLVFFRSAFRQLDQPSLVAG